MKRESLSLRYHRGRPVRGRTEALLLRLLDAEQADRQARSLRYQLKAARFPIHRDLTGFDWSETPLDEDHIQELAKGHYIETAHNLILVGGTGTGKTHLAIAPGVTAIHHAKRIRFYNAVDLVNLLEREKAQGKAGNLAKKLIQIDAVILDELGYLPFSCAGLWLRPPAAHCCFISSANSTKRHPSSSQPISASLNGAQSSAMQK
jgi:DNA replication protein DnaC